MPCDEKADNPKPTETQKITVVTPEGQKEMTEHPQLTAPEAQKIAEQHEQAKANAEHPPKCDCLLCWLMED